MGKPCATSPQIKNMIRIKAKYGYNGRKMKSEIETLFAHELECKRLAGKIKSWEYEPQRLSLFPAEFKAKQFYIPDFVVINNDGSLDVFEVKGWGKYREKGIAHLKWAAALYHKEYRFFLIDYSGKTYIKTEITEKKLKQERTENEMYLL